MNQTASSQELQEEESKNSTPLLTRLGYFLQSLKTRKRITLLVVAIAIPLTVSLALTQQILFNRAEGLPTTPATPPGIITPTPIFATPTAMLTPTLPFGPTVTPKPFGPTVAPKPTFAPTSIPTPFLDKIPPTVIILSPRNGAVVIRNSTVVINASASDNVKVNRVNFAVNNIQLCSDRIYPYSCLWRVSAIPNMKYRITATAYDNSSNWMSTTIFISSSR